MRATKTTRASERKTVQTRTLTKADLDNLAGGVRRNPVIIIDY